MKQAEFKQLTKEERKKTLSVLTVRNRFRQANIYDRVASNLPYLNEPNRKKDKHFMNSTY